MGKKWIYGVLIVAMSLSFVSAADHYFEITRNLDVFTALFRDVNSSYVDDTDPSKLMRTCIDGMLKTLDPFTNYISESQIETYRMMNSEKLVEIGIHFQIMDSVPVVSDVIKDLPADKAGLQIGDKMIALDGQPTKGKSYDEVTMALHGQANTAINITLQTIKGEKKDVSVTRQEYMQTNVPYSGMLTPQIGCINLKVFNPNAGKDVKNESMHDIRQKPRQEERRRKD